MQRNVYVSPSIHCTSLNVAYIGRDAAGRQFVQQHDYGALTASKVIVRGGSRLVLKFPSETPTDDTNSMTPVALVAPPAASLLPPPSFVEPLRVVEEQAAMQLFKHSFAIGSSADRLRIDAQMMEGTQQHRPLFAGEDNDGKGEEKLNDDDAGKCTTSAEPQPGEGEGSASANNNEPTRVATFRSADFIRQVLLRIVLQLFASSGTGRSGPFTVQLARHDALSTRFQVSRRQQVASDATAEVKQFQISQTSSDEAEDALTISACSAFSSEAAERLLMRESKKMLTSLQWENLDMDGDGLPAATPSPWVIQRCASIIALCGHAMAFDKFASAAKSPFRESATANPVVYTSFEVDDIVNNNNAAQCWRTFVICSSRAYLLVGSSTAAVAWTRVESSGVVNLDVVRSLPAGKWTAGSMADALTAL